MAPTGDDGCYNVAREIFLVYGHCIDSISVAYDNNGRPAVTERDGGLRGNNTAEVKPMSLSTCSHLFIHSFFLEAVTVESTWYMLGKNLIDIMHFRSSCNTQKST